MSGKPIVKALTQPLRALLLFTLILKNGSCRWIIRMCVIHGSYVLGEYLP